jgi:hypothetical protein
VVRLDDGILLRPKGGQHVPAGRRLVLAIGHFGGASLENPWQTIIDASIRGSYHIYEGARKHGTKRVIYPSRCTRDPLDRSARFGKIYEGARDHA